MSLSRTLRRENPDRFRPWGVCRICNQTFSKFDLALHFAIKHPWVLKKEDSHDSAAGSNRKDVGRDSQNPQ